MLGKKDRPVDNVKEQASTSLRLPIEKQYRLSSADIQVQSYVEDAQFLT